MASEFNFDDLKEMVRITGELLRNEDRRIHDDFAAFCLLLSAYCLLV